MLEVRNISYTIQRKNILKDISFEGKAGCFIGILGPNGAGKSTLLKLLSREHKTQNGTIFLNGKNIHEYEITDLARNRAVMTQSITMTSQFTVHEVVMMGRYAYFKNTPSQNDICAVKKALDKTGLNDYGQRTYSSLSGGEQQRVQFARVLAQMDHDATKPKLLLLDEPLNNLDIKYQHQLMESAMNFAQKGNLVMAVLHDINLASLYAHELLLMAKGQLKAIGEAREVINEKILEECYDFPVKVAEHPYHKCPVVYFGCPALQKTETFQNQLKYDTEIQL